MLTINISVLDTYPTLKGRQKHPTRVGWGRVFETLITLGLIEARLFSR